jgi:tRNA pseudouridine55 synthase
VSVTAHAIELVNVRDNLVALRIACSTGFYVRALANDLGMALGTGGHLVALRRTEAGGMTLAAAVSLAAIEDGPAGLSLAKEAFVPLRGMLPGMPAMTLTEDGARRAAHGAAIGPDR